MPYEILPDLPEIEEGKSTRYEILPDNIPSIPSEIGRKSAIAAKSVVSPIAGSYGDVQDLLLSLTSKAFGVNPERVREKLRSLAESDEEIPYLIPGSSEIKQSIENILPGSKAETPIEKGLEETLELGSNLANPLLGGVGLGRALAGTAAGMGAKKLSEEAGLGTGTQEIAKTIASIIPLVVTGKLTPTSQESKALYDAGIRAGLSEKELTPLLVSDKKLGRLGKIAKQSPKLTERMGSIESTLGDFYKDIKSRSKNLPVYTESQTKNLLNKMEDISSSWKKTLKAAPDKEAAIKYLDEAIEKLKSEGASPESLINFYQDINSAVNWRAIKGGKKELSEVKNAIVDSMKNTSPEIAKDFESANKLWSKLENFRSKVGWGDLEKYIELGKFAPFLYGIAKLDIPSLVSMGLITSGAQAARRIGTEFLTNPSWQSISRNSIKAVEKNSPKIAALAYNQFKSKVKKDMPEEYKEINWPQ